MSNSNKTSVVLNTLYVVSVILAIASGGFGIYGHQVQSIGLQTASAVLGIITFSLVIATLVIHQRNIDSSLETLVTQMEKFKKDVLTGLEYLKELHANEFPALMAKIEEMGSDGNNKFHVQKTNKVFKSVVHNELLEQGKKLVEASEEISKASDNNPNLEIKEIWPVYDTLYQMSLGLPSGGVWLGITRLENPSAWKNPVIRPFKDMKNNVGERAEKGEITVFRLYVFSSEDVFKELEEDLISEASKGINIKYIYDKPGGDRLRDISILWKPAQGSNGKADFSGNVTNPIEVINNAAFERLCGISFTDYLSAILTEAQIHAPESDEFQKLVDHFSQSWKAAKFLKSENVKQ